ncbi:hypothetical protein CR513_06550, partial [Mucuna pruriens]
MDRNMIDAASGGALMDKTPAATRHLISNMAVVWCSRRSRHLKGNKQGQCLRQLKVGELADKAHVSCEATCCRTVSTSHATCVWNIHFSGAPYQHVPHFAGG